MRSNKYILAMFAMIVALGGLLMGFDASVISGVLRFIEPEFGLSKLELGWSVASLTLTATLAMMFAGPLSDVYGRRTILRYAAILYAVSALGSALAPTFLWLVIARMVGGLGVGTSLILAPMYIAEMAPPELRGRMVSFNQLNIVIGISLAFFTNYLILQWGKSDASWALSLKLNEYNWRWMLGLETLPAILYYIGLFFVPKSPRWLLLKGKTEEARKILTKLYSAEEADKAIEEIQKSNPPKDKKSTGKIADLLDPKLRLVLSIGVVVAVLQQITGINSVFFYAPMIFEQSGLGTDASFVQAILVGLANLVFTVVAILFIDKLGRKPLLILGVSGIALCMFLLAYGFQSAQYEITADTFSMIENHDASAVAGLMGKTYQNEDEFINVISDHLLGSQLELHRAAMVTASIRMNTSLILFAILGFVASFAISIGPVMWVLFSELFPNRIRGIAISFVGLLNSAVSFMVQWMFPWQLENLGNATTFLIYGLFAAAGLLFIIRVIPETKGKSLEEIERQLVR